VNSLLSREKRQREEHLLNLISGIDYPDSGKSFQDYDLTGLPRNAPSAEEYRFISVLQLNLYPERY
jgi:hypothetical protein